jgi:peptidoglycan/xylan/chitin deacetylase (PgdA/CDA1 family)
VPFIYGRIARLTLKRKAIRSNAIVLTFDDGPGDRLTPAIMNLLDEYNAKATFFLLGRNISGREAIIRQVAEKGHEICSHSYEHLHCWKVSPFRALSDIKRGWEAINAAIGSNRKKYPFRPPYGKMNIICLLYLLIRQVPIIYWSVDSGDTWNLKPESNRVASLAKQAGGGISLAHDFDRDDDSYDKLVLESTQSLLSMAKETGMSVLTVSELLGSTK